MLERIYQASKGAAAGSTGEHTDTPIDEQSFFQRISIKLGTGRRQILALDNVTEMKEPDLESLLKLIQVIRIEQTSTGTSNLYVCLGLGIRDMQSYKTAQTIMNEVPATHVKVDWFTKEQTESLFRTLNLSDYSEKIWEQYQGQPFLTHKAAFEIANSRDPDEFYRSEAMVSAGSHAKAVHRLLSNEEHLRAM